MITAAFAILTILAAGPYWILTALGSMAGPSPDYGISVLLFIPILLHALLISKNSIVEKARCTLSYVAVVFALCLMRYWEQAHAPGFGEWFGNTSLLSFLICSGFFCIAFVAFAYRSTPSVDSRIPKAIQISVTLWLLILFSISSYLYAYRQISKLAISKGSYTATSNSSFVVFHGGTLSPRWCIKFLEGGSKESYVVSEIHSSMFGHIVLARGRNFINNG
jgi:hypothetical protein